jgi:hypothetical protein
MTTCSGMLLASTTITLNRFCNALRKWYGGVRNWRDGVRRRRSSLTRVIKLYILREWNEAFDET